MLQNRKTFIIFEGQNSSGVHQIDFIRLLFSMVITAWAGESGMVLMIVIITITKFIDNDISFINITNTLIIGTNTSLGRRKWGGS